MISSDKQFLYNLVSEYYDGVKEDRAQTFENALAYIDNNIREEQVNRWCELNELSPMTAKLLNYFQCDIQEILSELLAEQEALDREATEEYEEIQRTYREEQGW